MERKVIHQFSKTTRDRGRGQRWIDPLGNYLDDLDQLDELAEERKRFRKEQANLSWRTQGMSGSF